MKLHKITLMILVVCVSACASQISTPTTQPSKVLTSTPTKVPTHTPTPELSSVFKIQSHCPENSHDASSLSGLPGTMVLGRDSVLVFRDTQSKKETVYQLPDDQIYYYYVVSPNQEHLALTEGKTLANTSDVIVLTPDGQQETKFSLPGDWTLFDWLNDEKLLSRQIRLRAENLDLVAINPITGEQEFLPSNFPNLYSNETLFFWEALTIFDPTASLVVYPERKDNTLISAIWDVHGEKEIANIVGGEWPKWSPNGNHLLIVADQDAQLHRIFNEIFIVTPEGEVTRSTFFKDNFENSKISTPVWSPNGRYIAFWLSTVLPVKTARLAVLDTETSTVDLYCKEVEPFPYRMGENNTLGYAYYQVNSAPPIWSPDSKYLLIEDYQEFRSSTYLLALQSHTITRIADNTRPVGWMK